jgi:hypothetical protein
MFLITAPPVNVFSTVDDVRDWIVELSEVRARYRHDAEALRCVAHEEQYAARLLDLIPTLPPLPTWARTGRVPTRTEA